MDRITREHIQLTREQTAQMMDSVRSGKPKDFDKGEWHHRVNSILNAMRVQQEAPEGFADFLIETASRRDEPVLGLYALQHLSMWLPKESDAEKQQAIKDLFLKLMRTPGEPMAGTAVLMSSDLEQQHVEGFDPAHIEKTAILLVSDKQAPQDVRVSALHACSDRQLTAVLDDARRIAADKGEVSILRKAAIHAIGRMGLESDLPLLAEISKESRHLAAATTPATTRISQRVAKP